MDNKTKLFFIVRGFLYREDWTPLSKRNQHAKNYIIDFFDTENNFKKTIDALSSKYNICLYFSTYDTTPKLFLQKIKDNFPGCEIIISSETGSSQFTTVIQSLKHIEKYCTNQDLILLIRSDIIIKEPLFKLLNEYNFDKDILYVLAKEKEVKTDIYTHNIVIDILQIFYGSHLIKVLNYFSQPKLGSGHRIHRKIYTNVMVPIEESYPICPSTYLCSYFFDIKNNDTTWWPIEPDYGETIYNKS